ncbi:MAG TPA: hypothetical protein VIJ12_11180 [Candidatus Baltobacteraceae bacterium]
MNPRVAMLFSLLTGALLLVCARPALATPQMIDHGGVYWGDVFVDRGQVVHGDITVLRGDAIVEGVVDGNLNVLDGNVDERPGSQILGQVNQVGGDAPFVTPFAPHGLSHWRLTWGIFADVVVLLAFLLFPTRVRTALGRLEHHPGLCGAIGLGGFVAVIPLMIFLIITIVLIPLIPVEMIALVVGVFIGKAAISLLVGRRLCVMLGPNAAPSETVALIVGLVLVTAAELVPVLGGLVTLLVWLIGLGAAILTFVNEHTFSGQTPATGTVPPPIAGPPMTVA